jgi:hypothetical protein
VENELDIALTDTGEPMPNGEPPIGKAPSINVQFADLLEGGFGWFLKRCLPKILHIGAPAASTHWRSIRPFASK